MAHILVLTASMGGGHDGVAAELARRLCRDGHDVDVLDILTLFPGRLGNGLRGGYRSMMRAAPWVYDAIYRGFFVPHSRVAPDASPAVHLVASGLRPVIAARPPDVVVSTFHLAGQAANQLRREGSVRAPSAVLVTEAEAHALWRDPTTDLYLCIYPGQAEQLRRELNVDARRVQPVVRPEFTSRRSAAARPSPPSGCGRTRVLVSTGSWGVGHPERAARTIAGTGRYEPVVLCGHNERLRRRLARTLTCDVLGWVPELAPLMSQAAVLVENAGGGLTCWEAFARNLPVVTFQPIPGHGRAGARRLEQSGLSVFPSGCTDLVHALDDLSSMTSATRDRLRAAEAAMFDAGTPQAADVIMELASAHTRSVA